jgi:archaellum component FlaC
MDGKTKGGRKGLGKKGKGKGSELAAAGRGARAAALPDVPHGALPPGPVPRLSATEAKQPADLHSKAGEEQLAAKYRAIAVSLDKSERAPAPSLQQQVQSAHAAVRRKERALQVEFAKLNRWRAELEEQRKKVAELHSELGEADAAYKKVVLELQQQVPSEPAPAAAAQVTLEQLVDGTVSIDQIISTDVLEVADDAYDLEEQDRKEIQQRKDELSEKVREAAKSLFQDALSKIKEAKEQHTKHLERLGKKRKTGAGNVSDAATLGGEAAAAGEGSGQSTGAGSSSASSSVSQPEPPEPDIRTLVADELSNLLPLPGKGGGQ